MIQFGNDKIKEIYVGSDKIKEVYYGSQLVWSGKKPSYLITTDNTRIDFELENTPMNNFGGQLSYVVVNGSTIEKITIKELVFGDSYKNVTNISNNFLWGCSNLTSLDLSAFSNVTNIGSYFLRGCSNLTSLDLSAFSNVTNISDNFLRACSNLTSLDLSAFSNVTSIGPVFLTGCSSLTSLDLGAFSNVTRIGANFLDRCSALIQFKMGVINVPSTSTNSFLSLTPNLTTILVPIQSVQEYRTTAPWSNHASKIQGY